MVVTQRLLGELADAGLWNFINPDDALRHLPLSNFSLEMGDHGFFGQRIICTHHAGECCLAPLGVHNANHRCFDHLRMRHDFVLEFNRRNPFTA